MTGKLLDRLRRRFAGLSNQWIATVEVHRSGMPHLNLMIWNPSLASYIESLVFERETRGLLGRNRVLLDGDLLDCVTAAGWGVQATAERARDWASVASYMVKVAGKGDRTASELAKLTQLPLNAPARFRRLRSGREFLPPRRTNPEVTGTMVRRCEVDGAPCVLPLTRTKTDPMLIARMCGHEEDRWLSELQGQPSTLVVRVVLRPSAPDP
jgi:hypothetical protein